MASSSTPSASPDEARATLQSGTVLDAVKSVDSADHSSTEVEIDLPSRIHAECRYEIPLTLVPK